MKLIDELKHLQVQQRCAQDRVDAHELRIFQLTEELNKERQEMAAALLSLEHIKETRTKRSGNVALSLVA